MPTVRFRLPNGCETDVPVKAGSSVLEAARLGDVAIEGACGGSMACATCHVIVARDQFDQLEPASDEEEDMLDLAESLAETSRLGCQIRVDDETDPLIVTVPPTSFLP